MLRTGIQTSRWGPAEAPLHHEDVELEHLARRVDDLNEQLFDLAQEAAAARAEADAWREKLAIAERFVAVARDALHAARALRDARAGSTDSDRWQSVVLSREFEAVFARALAFIDDEAAVVDAYACVDDIVRFLFGVDGARLADGASRGRIVEALRRRDFLR